MTFEEYLSKTFSDRVTENNVKDIIAESLSCFEFYGKVPPYGEIVSFIVIPRKGRFLYHLHKALELSVDANSMKKAFNYAMSKQF